MQLLAKDSHGRINPIEMFSCFVSARFLLKRHSALQSYMGTLLSEISYHFHESLSDAQKLLQPYEAKQLFGHLVSRVYIMAVSEMTLVHLILAHLIFDHFLIFTQNWNTV